MPVHPIPPLFDENSEILILGSFPSVKSREEGFFYAHKQNRFWRVAAALFGCPVPITIDEKKEMILRHHFALWDVIHSCDITGSSDSSIRNVVPNDLSVILSAAPIRKIAVNGQKAAQFYRKYQQNITGVPAIVLPSTSPANAAWSEARLITAWRAALFD